jgi:hypothetical protein
MVASSSTPSDGSNLGADIHEPHWRRSQMVEISYPDLARGRRG